MKIQILINVAFFACSCLSVFGQETYRWVDEKGTVHFTDDQSVIPPKYFDRIEKKTVPKQDRQNPPEQPMNPPPADMQTTEQKDMLGRGEPWWRARMTEWSQKLDDAQRNHHAAREALDEKTKELDQAKFKPDSFKRKLKADLKNLEEKLREASKQVEDARNMLQKGLPKEAEENRADPNWVRRRQADPGRP